MSTLPCPYCKLEVSQFATVCPHCTQEIETIHEDNDGKRLFIWGIGLGLIFPPFVSIFTHDFIDLIENYYFSKDWWLYWIVIPLAAGSALQYAYVRLFRMGS